jgi:hypothetical protein
MFSRQWQYYKAHESAFRLILDVLFIALFCFMGIVYQPEIIYVCNQTMPVIISNFTNFTNISIIG